MTSEDEATEDVSDWDDSEPTVDVQERKAFVLSLRS
jgi:hypothetical protein